MQVRAANSGDDVSEWIRRSWGDTVVAVHDTIYDVPELPALVVADGRALLGVLAYAIDADEMEIVSCSAAPVGHGTGRRLVEAAVDLGCARGLRRVWCTTTNDNLAALGFWQALGFAMIELRPNAVEAARRLKPSIPTHGYLGLPIRDELDLERLLSPVAATEETTIRLTSPTSKPVDER